MSQKTCLHKHKTRNQKRAGRQRTKSGDTAKIYGQRPIEIIV
jgi:hypothetical protein